MILAYSMPGPAVLTPIAVFFAITAGLWWLFSSFGGDVEPTVENRLEELRNPRARTAVATTTADDKAKKKSGLHGAPGLPGGAAVGLS